jgi:hypothetical protein
MVPRPAAQAAGRFLLRASKAPCKARALSFCALSQGIRMKNGIFTAAIASLCLLVAACGGSYSRGQFAGFVTNATEAQIVERVGKPDEIDASNPNKQVWVYRKRTFDPDNMNQVDGRTMVILERDAQGNLIGRDVVYG